MRFLNITIAPSFAIAVLYLAVPAEAQQAMPPPVLDAAPPAADAEFNKSVGGHIGVATPLVTVGDETQSIADQFTILNPIGIGIKVSPSVVVDFEVVVANPIDPNGATGLVVDPGVVYDWGVVATGLRIAWNTSASNANVGLIPLVNRGLVDLGGATWFIEAAFPTFYEAKDLTFNVVLHTGVGF